MSRKRVKHSKRINRLLSSLSLFCIGSAIVLPTHSTINQLNPVTLITNRIQSGWSTLRLKSERIVNTFDGIYVINEGLSTTGAVKKGDPVVSEPNDTLFIDWSIEKFPDYYTVLGEAQIDLSLFGQKGEIIYSDLDLLGRTGVARGSLTFDNVSASYGARQTFSDSDNPSGWTDNKKARIEWIDGKVYNGYFWNRSHLIGDALGGDAILQNAITGTRTQNVGGVNQKGGMRYTEIIVQEYLEKHRDVVVYYQVTPLYSGEELIPRATLVDYLSSDGVLNEQVYVFNEANGFEINYYTGEFTQVS